MAELDKEVSQAAQDAKPHAAPQVTPDGKLEGVAANAQEATAALRALVDRVRPFVRVPAVPDVVPGAYDEVEGLKAPLLAADGAAALAEALAAAAGVATADRALGCVVGMCVGDAVGAPLEFSQCCDGGQDKGLRWVAATNSYPGGEVNNFGLKRGQWTDDASMGLALADSLLATGGFDGADARIRWHLWWARGYANAFKYDGDGSKRSVGLGGNISRSLGALEPGERPPPAYEAPREDAGNGSVMRLGAVPVRYFRDAQGLTRAATGSSRATHPGALAAECCGSSRRCAPRPSPMMTRPRATRSPTVARALARGVRGCLLGRKYHADAPAPAKAMRLLLAGDADPAVRPNLRWAWRSAQLPILATMDARGPRYNGYPNTAGYFGSFCMDAVAIALHCVHATTSFVDAVERASTSAATATRPPPCAANSRAPCRSAVPAPLLDQLRTWDRDEAALRALLLWDAAHDPPEGVPQAPAPRVDLSVERRGVRGLFSGSQSSQLPVAVARRLEVDLLVVLVGPRRPGRFRDCENPTSISSFAALSRNSETLFRSTSSRAAAGAGAATTGVSGSKSSSKSSP